MKMNEYFLKYSHLSDPNGTKNGTNDLELKLHRIILELVQNLFQVR